MERVQFDGADELVLDLVLDLVTPLKQTASNNSVSGENTMQIPLQSQKRKHSEYKRRSAEGSGWHCSSCSTTRTPGTTRGSILMNKTNEYLVLFFLAVKRRGADGLQSLCNACGMLRCLLLYLFR